VFDEAPPMDYAMAGEPKDAGPNEEGKEQFEDVTHTLKKSKRNRTPNNQE
jgi:hypothetical protein